VNGAIAVASVVTFISFSIAAILAFVYLPRRWGSSAAPLLILAAAMLCEAFIGLSNALQYSGITGALDLFEDFAEILFAPLIVFSLFAAEVQLRLREQAQASRVLQGEHDMLLNIVDTTPSGILIVAPGGHVTYANDAARDLLAISEDADTGDLHTEAWTMTDEAGRPCSLDDLLRAPGAVGLRRGVAFPDGRRSDFLFSVTTMGDQNQAVGGAVIGVQRA